MEGEKENFSTIIWVKDLGLPKGTDGRVAIKLTSTGKIKCIIYLNPDSIEDPFIIAHEMGHPLLKRNESVIKIKTHVPNKTNLILMQSLSDMFQDPVVDLMLQDKYGFDLVAQYKKDLRRRKKTIKQYSEPKDSILRIIETTDYVRYALYSILMKNEETSKAWSTFQAVSKLKRRITSKMGDEVINIILENEGVDTIEKQRTIFKKISEKYGLKDILYLE